LLNLMPLPLPLLLPLLLLLLLLLLHVMLWRCPAEVYCLSRMLRP
jgi:hypothetical protein